MSHIAYEQRAQVYTNAFIRFGEHNQYVVAIEELSECQKEVCKMLRGIGDMNHLAEEIADATIMLEQLKMHLNLNESVRTIMDQKVKRLDQKLRKEAFR